MRAEHVVPNMHIVLTSRAEVNDDRCQAQAQMLKVDQAPVESADSEWTEK